MAVGTARKRKPADHYRKLFAPFLVERKPGEPDDWSAYCPAHEHPATSKKPSAYIMFDDGTAKHGMLWYCFVCDPPKGSPETHLDVLEERMMARDDIDDIIDRPVDLAAHRVAKKAGTPVTMSKWDAGQCMERLLTNPVLMKHLEDKRGINEGSIIDHTIGWLPSRGAFTIPVFGHDDEIINVKMAYKDPVKSGRKYDWYTVGVDDHPLMFGNLIRPGDDVLVVEGEWDAILARQMGFNAVSATRGAKKWAPEDTRALEGCHVTIMYDNDDKPEQAGQVGSASIAKAIKKAGLSLSVRLVQHDVPGADFTDLVVKHGWKRGQFTSLFASAQEISLTRKSSLPTKGKRVPFDQLTSRDSNLEIVESTVLANAVIDHSLIPWQVLIECDTKSAPAAKCELCPMKMYHAKAEGAEWESELDRTSRDVMLPMIGIDDAKLQKHIRSVHGLNCNAFTFERKVDVDVQHVITSSPVLAAEATEGDENTSKMVLVYMLGAYKIEAGTVLRIVGRNEPDAKRQASIFFSWHWEDDNPLSERKVLSGQEFDALKIFRPSEDQSGLEKLLEIAGSINAQYGTIDRDALGAAYLLTFMSVLDFRFRGDKQHGWLQSMVVGDTRTGKSKVASNFLAHMGYGTRIACDVVTRPGLIGGVTGTGSSTSSGKYLRFGLLARCDRRMAVLDEVTNALEDDDLMHVITEMRSSGVMTVGVLDGGSFKVRVRQVWMSNPPGRQTLRDIPHRGIGAIGRLISTPQDLARFDWVYAVALNDKTSATINTGSVSRKRSKYLPALCRLLIEWIWTRQIDDIVFEEGLEDEIGKIAQIISEKYRSNDYLVIPGAEAGVKIARIAAAFAAGQFSTNNGIEVLVTQEHVEAAAEFLDLMLGSDDLGLKDHISHERAEHESGESSLSWLRKQISKNDDIHNACVWLASAGSSFDRRAMTDGFDGNGVLNPRDVEASFKQHSLISDLGSKIRMSQVLRETLESMRNEGKLRVPRNGS